MNNEGYEQGKRDAREGYAPCPSPQPNNTEYVQAYIQGYQEQKKQIYNQNAGLLQCFGKVEHSIVGNRLWGLKGDKLLVTVKCLESSTPFLLKLVDSRLALPISYTDLVTYVDDKISKVYNFRVFSRGFVLYQ